MTSLNDSGKDRSGGIVADCSGPCPRQTAQRAPYAPPRVELLHVAATEVGTSTGADANNTAS